MCWIQHGALSSNYGPSREVQSKWRMEVSMGRTRRSYCNEQRSGRHLAIWSRWSSLRASVIFSMITTWSTRRSLGLSFTSVFSGLMDFRSFLRLLQCVSPKSAHGQYRIPLFPLRKQSHLLVEPVPRYLTPFISNSLEAQAKKAQSISSVSFSLSSFVPKRKID